MTDDRKRVEELRKLRMTAIGIDSVSARDAYVLLDRLDAAEAERDAAESARADAARLLGRCSAPLDAEEWENVCRTLELDRAIRAKLYAERNALRAERDAAVKERDEAREMHRDAVWNATHAKRERDEARRAAFDEALAACDSIGARCQCVAMLRALRDRGGEPRERREG